MSLTKLGLSAIFLFCLSINSLAQSNPPPPGNPDPVDASIENQIYLLMFAGLILGSFVLVKKKSKR
jgi:hypothetical protein